MTADAPSGHQRKSRPLAALAVFALLGPLIGYLVITPALPLTTDWEATDLPLAVVMVLHPMVWIAAYIFGGPPALITGLAMTAWRRASRPPNLDYVVAASTGVISTAVYVLAFIADSGRADPQSLAAFTLIGALAAVICTWLTRNWR